MATTSSNHTAHALVEERRVIEVTRRTEGQEEEKTFQVTFLVRGPHALTDEHMSAMMRAAVVNGTEGAGSSSSSSSSSIDGARAGEAEEEEGDGVRVLGLNEENEG
jgi:hypothetical protein